MYDLFLLFMHVLGMAGIDKNDKAFPFSVILNTRPELVEGPRHGNRTGLNLSWRLWCAQQVGCG